MKKLLYLICLFTVISSETNASHIVGAQLYYDYLGGNSYKITFVEYRNCTYACMNCAEYDEPVYIQLFDTAGNYIDTIAIPLPPRDTLPIADSVHCSLLAASCIEIATFQITVRLPFLPGGYVLVYERCCRNSAIVNIPNNSGASYSTAFVDSTRSFGHNSSPRFKLITPQISPIDTPFLFDISATDPDGDSLSYSLVNALDYTGSSSNFLPIPAYPPPFPSVSYVSPYSATNPTNNPLDSGYLRINASTGMLSGRVNQSSIFLVAVAADEYRNGVHIGRTFFDFQFTFTDCIVNTAVNPIIATNIKIYSADNRAIVEFPDEENQAKITFYNLLGQELASDNFNTRGKYTKEFYDPIPQCIITRVESLSGKVFYKKLISRPSKSQL